MKRAGQLMAAIAEPENLRQAFLKAARGKRGKADCRAFGARLDENLATLRVELLSGQVRVGDYHQFKIFDPKERTICAADFRQRVLHHAVMAVCEPVLERAAVFDSYACRKGKGRLAAVERASGYARRHDWFLKMDVRKYFASIDHLLLERLLERRFKDPAVLALFGVIIRSHETAPGRGLPIGNLTSQHFANYYLAPLDRFIKERLRRRAYLRYMDDFVVWGGTREELKGVRERVREFLAEELKLELKAEPCLNRTAMGMDFLGYRLFPGTLRLARRSKVRFSRKFRAYERAFVEGEWGEAELQRRVQALLAFVMPADSAAFRRHVLERFGVAAIGLEPRDPRWQLEQQRQELPVGEPQQQQPVEQEQQHWVPGCAGPSSTGAPEGALADPAAIPSCAA
jgi:retron-type reverse transcriptase